MRCGTFEYACCAEKGRYVLNQHRKPQTLIDMTEFKTILEDQRSLLFFATLGIYLLLVLKVLIVNVLFDRDQDRRDSDAEQ
jgi:hypothetical protein